MFKNLKEALAFAYTMEEGSEQFYKELASKSKDPSKIKLFKGLELDERDHKERIKNLSRNAEFISNLPIKNIYGTFDEIKGSEIDDMSEREIFEFLVRKEDAAYNLYTALCETSNTKAINELLTKLATEEKSHKERFLAELKNL